MKGYKRLPILIRTGWSRLRDFEAKRSKANLRHLHSFKKIEATSEKPIVLYQAELL